MAPTWDVPVLFPILQKNGCSKTPKGPLLHFSALCDVPETKKNSKKISKIQNSKKSDFFLFFPHAGTKEENT